MESSVQQEQTTDSNEGVDLKQEVMQELDTLISASKNFNLHINVLKRLLSLKERQQTAHEPSGVLTSPSTSQQRNPSIANQPDELLIAIKTKLDQLQAEVQLSHSLGFCLAFNVQRLQQRLTGLPVDATGTENVLDNLWERYQKSKSGEAMLKYEFEEKRKLLRKLRQQLEQTRRDWKQIKLRKPEVPTEEEQLMWEQLRADIASKNARRGEPNQDLNQDNRSPSEVDSAVHSDDGEGDQANDDDQVNQEAVDMLLVFDERRHRLNQLEEECFQLVSRLAHRESENSETLVSDEDDEDDDADSTARYHSPLIAADLLVDEDDLAPSSEAEDFDEAPLAEDHDQEALAFELDINSGLLDDTEDAEISDLPLDTPWDTSNEHSTATQLAVNQPEVRVTLAHELENAIVSETDVQDAEVIRITRSRTSSQISNTDEEEEQRLRESLAETGEPIVLCRLRRKAVEILISRLREEKKFHETRENELHVQMTKLKDMNYDLRSQLERNSWFTRSLGVAMVSVAIVASFVSSSLNMFT